MSEKEIPKGTEVVGNVAAHLDARFLNSIILRGILDEKGTTSLEVTIDRLEHHDKLKYQNGQVKDNALLLYFKGSKRPLQLCQKNVKTIIRQHGAIGKGWDGKKIKLEIQQDRRPDLGGKMGDCVRVATNLNL